MLRKSFLIIGIVLLILGFFFFYWAGSDGWDYTTTYNNNVNLNSPTGYGDYGFGAVKVYSVTPFSSLINMEPDDFITVSYPSIFQTNGIVYIMLAENMPTATILVYYPNLNHTAPGWLGFKNYQSYNIHVSVLLATPNAQNVTISTTTILHHYQIPQWVYLGIGVVLLSLAVIPISKSKKL